ncbi:sulfotransferase family protein [Nocardioides daejeonensis]|uniref:sulfotransferase family protein n=1 Tax=Nocardioides daejeonensis TaxID=1046556 RepID=UPI000D7406EA|nr:sulfotransferase [Nocardioides daejeonensis]
MPLPTYVILGAQKCGTSSLSATFRRHRQIHTSRPKELHYFDRPKGRTLEWYAEQFKPLPHHRAWGEATPSYLYDAEARDRCVEALPDAKFIVMLRDPAKRAYSHFWHNHRLGFEDLEVFEEALDQEPARLDGDSRTARIRFSYLDRGRYIDQLEALEERVGRERIHVVLLEDLVAERVPTLEQVFTYVGVDASWAEKIPAVHTNKYRVEQSDGSTVAAAYPPLNQQTRARIVTELAPETRRLEAWLHRDLSAWLHA